LPQVNSVRVLYVLARQPTGQTTCCAPTWLAIGGEHELLADSQRIFAYFNYSNMGPSWPQRWLMFSGIRTSPLPLLIGFIVVVAIVDLLITGAIAKWAIFAPIFVPLLMKLGVAPKPCWQPIGSAIPRQIQSRRSTPTSHWSSDLLRNTTRTQGPNGCRATVALRHLDVGHLDAALRRVVSLGTSLGVVVTSEAEDFRKQRDAVSVA
jgi:AbgT putative transporter family